MVRESTRAGSFSSTVQRSPAQPGEVLRSAELRVRALPASGSELVQLASTLSAAAAIQQTLNP
jgi:hypothetical protein